MFETNLIVRRARLSNKPDVQTAIESQKQKESLCSRTYRMVSKLGNVVGQKPVSIIVFFGKTLGRATSEPCNKTLNSGRVS